MVKVLQELKRKVSSLGSLKIFRTQLHQAQDTQKLENGTVENYQFHQERLNAAGYHGELIVTMIKNGYGGGVFIGDHCLTVDRVKANMIRRARSQESHLSQGEVESEFQSIFDFMRGIGAVQLNGRRTSLTPHINDIPEQHSLIRELLLFARQ